MKNLLKKVALLLSFAMIFSAMPMGVFAADATGNVAEVNGKGYPTLREAIEAAEPGGKVVLTSDTTLDESDKVTASSICLKVDKELTVDLNGFKITSPNVGFYVIKNGKLTIMDSDGKGKVISGTDVNANGVTVFAYEGEAIINGGTYNMHAKTENVNNAGHNGDMIYTYGGGKITINGGKFEHTQYVWTLNCHDANRGTITVNGGTFEGFNPADNVSEGASTNFVAPTSFVTKVDNNWVVEKADADAVSSEAELRAVLEAGATSIKLDKNIELTAGVVIDKELTINLNGKELTADPEAQASTALIKAVNGANLTITGNGTVNSATNGNDYSIAVWAAEGANVTIENGTFTNVGAKDFEDNGNANNNELIYVSSTGKITILDGTFTGNTENETYGVRYALNKQDGCAGTIVVKGGKYYQYDPSSSHSENPVGNFVEEGLASVKDGDYYVVKDVADLNHDVVVEAPTIDTNSTTTNTGVSETEKDKIAEIGNNIVDAIKDAAAAENPTEVVNVITDAVADLNLPAAEQADVVGKLAEAVANNEEITIKIEVSSEAVDENDPAVDTDEIDAIKAAIEAAGLVADEDTVLDITVTKTISTSSSSVDVTVELSNIGEENAITHTVVFPEVPDVVEGMQRVWTMYSYHNGNIETYPVKDNGDGTGEFTSHLYSYYVLAYEVVPVEQAADHNWSDDFKMNDEYHWRYCKSCGIKKTRHAHVDVNKDGSCDACDYRVTSTGRENPVTGVTADMLK
ncbi:MAG: hypothetical protein E7488_05215 [Ruminococcaceae bacterium]|nr:hypothetical protein [Oscillospiraceae bacterium]